MSHGVIMVATSNRHPDELYRNGIQRESFLPCIALLKNRLRVVNLDSPTDYRRMARPPANVYRYPLGSDAVTHADRWFSFLGDPKDTPHSTSHKIWGRDIKVPLASGRAAKFTFKELCESPLSAADYLELCRRYKAFVVTDVPTMDYKTRDLARRFITFIDAVYESRVSAMPLKLYTPPLQKNHFCFCHSPTFGFMRRVRIGEPCFSSHKEDTGRFFTDRFTLVSCFDPLLSIPQTIFNSHIFDITYIN